MNSFLLDKVLAPILSGVAELCEKNGINCIFYVEYNDGLLDTLITHHLNDKKSDEISKALECLEGRK